MSSVMVIECDEKQEVRVATLFCRAVKMGRPIWAARIARFFPGLGLKNRARIDIRAFQPGPTKPAKNMGRPEWAAGRPEWAAGRPQARINYNNKKRVNKEGCL
ncbi:hypothetical protein QL285_061189 [Trifolium repens]|nr:hypothetical protein QL285_061189 [Trifolium repens]